MVDEFMKPEFCLPATVSYELPWVVPALLGVSAVVALSYVSPRYSAFHVALTLFSGVVAGYLLWVGVVEALFWHRQFANCELNLGLGQWIEALAPPFLPGVVAFIAFVVLMMRVLSRRESSADTH